MPAVGSSVQADSTYHEVSTLSREGGQAFNFFDMSKSETLPVGLRAAQKTFAPHLEQLARRFGFQESSIANQEEHLAVLLTNATSRATSGKGLDALHAHLLSSANLRPPV